MNISIKNENTYVMEALDAEIIKTLNGCFNKENIVNDLNNLYYNKVILDITAINNYYDENTLFDFLSIFGPGKVILVLNNTYNKALVDAQRTSTAVNAAVKNI